MQKNIPTLVEKIDVEDLIKDFRVSNVSVFVSYLKEIWRVYKIIIYS